MPPQARAMQIVQAAMGGKLIAVLTEAGVPDALADGARTVEEIARETRLNPDALGRALRAAELLGVFRHTDSRWENTDVGEALRSATFGSIREYVIYALHDGNWRAWQYLGDALRTGMPSFPEANGGLSFWEYLDAHDDVALAFHRAMAAMAAVSAQTLAPALRLDRFSSVTDIGGGSGILIAELLRATPNLHAVLYDRSDALAEARERFAREGFADRVRLEEGDLFERIPGGADAYVLKNVLHDHAPERCDRILELLHAAMPASARLFIVEAILPETASPHPAVWRDLHMMVALGGRERTESEWRRLLERHAFAIDRIEALPGPDAVIEVRKRE